MAIEIEALDCIACGACEMACHFYRSETLGGMTASIMLFRAEEKKNYFGMMLKTKDKLVLARPEGKEIQKLGEASGGGGASAAAKPILLREGCDECEDPLCLKFCPTGAIYIE